MQHSVVQQTSGEAGRRVVATDAPGPTAAGSPYGCVPPKAGVTGAWRQVREGQHVLPISDGLPLSGVPPRAEPAS